MFLNGAGVRSKFFVKVYVCALYLSERISSPEGVIVSRKTRRIELHMLRSMQASAIHEAMMKGLEDNVPVAELKRLKPQLGRLQQAMTSIGGVNEGAVIQFDFVPGQGTIVRIGGDVRNVRYNGAKVAESLKMVDWHVSYSLRDGFGYSDAVGCPVFSSAAVLAYNGPTVEEITRNGKTVGFVFVLVILSNSRMSNRPAMAGSFLPALQRA